MSNQPSIPPEPYPVVRFIVARGRHLAIALSLVVLLAGCWAAFQLGMVWLAPVALAGSGILLVILLSYVEVLTIIADTLIPKY